MTAIARHIADEAAHGRRSGLWHLCADKTCTRFVARAGFRCEECAVRAQRMRREMVRISYVLALRTGRPWLPVDALGQKGNTRMWWDEDARP